MYRRSHFLIVFCLLVLVALLSGCGREVQQRQALTSFLQKEVIPRNSGILVPTKAIRKKFGDYATHYDIIVNYNKAMLEQIGRPLEKSYREYAEAMKPEAGVKKRMEATVKYREQLLSFEIILGKELATAESQIAGLNQPEDLRVVYEQAVEKHVRIPARAFKLMIPAIIAMLNKNQELLDFISANKVKIEIKDGMIQVKDQSTLAQLNAMQAEISKMEKDIEAQHNEFARQAVGR